MQLKKRFQVTQKKMAIGVVTLVMAASSVPALAHDGLGLSTDVRAQIKSDFRDEQKDIKREMKDLRKGWKDLFHDVRLSLKFNGSATGTADGKVCRKEAKADFEASMKLARDEREAARKKAREDFRASLLAARATYHARMGVIFSATGTAQVEASASARLAYQDMVKKAVDVYAEAKKKLDTEFRKDETDARERLRRVTDACRAS